MQRAMVIAAALGVLTLSNANAAEWCGYGSHAKSLIECGYSSVADCENAVGKGGMCFVDPDYAANARSPPAVMAGLVPAIHDFRCSEELTRRRPAQDRA